MHLSWDEPLGSHDLNWWGPAWWNDSFALSCKGSLHWLQWQVWTQPPTQEEKTNMYFVARFPTNYMEATQKKHIMPCKWTSWLPVKDGSQFESYDWRYTWSPNFCVGMDTWLTCELMLKQGWISDDTFISWGFLADLNLLGEEVYHPNGVAQ